MGRDWKYWGSGSGSGLGSGSGSGKSNNNNGSRTTTATKKSRSHIQTSHAAAGTSTGCINAVFQLFDFHHFQPSTCNLWQQTVPSFKHLSEDQLEPSTTLKGAEAPRNSLEMIMDPPPIINPDQPPLTNIHPMRIRVPNRTEDLSSECSSSPGAPKTPNLVARLMGLDLLPQTSPRTSSSSSTYSSATNSTLKSRQYHLNSALKDSKTQTQLRPNHAKFILDTDFLGSRSLPETPRISSERRSEVDFHRLSLQSNRENSSELTELSRKSTGRRDLRVLEEEEENRSPGFYARQIVKQVKDNISRKVGSDITNTVRNNNKQSDQKQRDVRGGDDQILVLLKSKKPVAESRPTTAGDQDFPSSNCSPRLRFLELKNRGTNSQLSQTSKKSSTQQTHVTMSDVGTTSKHQSSVPKEEKRQSSDQKCGEIRRDQRLCLSSPNNKSQPPSDPMIKNKKEETFFRSKLGRKKEKPQDKKCKKTPLSTELLLTNNNVTNLFHVKRDPPSPLTKLPQKQEYNDARSSSERKTSTFHQTCRRDGSGSRLIFYSGNVGNRSWDLHDYVRRITAGSINLTGLYGSVDPSVFHRLEIEVSSLKLFDGSASVPINMSLRCNRLLVFDLVNEFLGMEEMSKKRSADLAHTICEKITNFESADCIVLEDIDAIIERDLRERKMRINGEDEEEEQKGIIEEIQQQLIDNLLEETALFLCY